MQVAELGGCVEHNGVPRVILHTLGEIDHYRLVVQVHLPAEPHLLTHLSRVTVVGVPC